MKKKLVAVLLAATMSIGLLAGCGGSGGASSSGDAASSGDSAGAAAGEVDTSLLCKLLSANAAYRTFFRCGISLVNITTY